MTDQDDESDGNAEMPLPPLPPGITLPPPPPPPHGMGTQDDIPEDADDEPDANADPVMETPDDSSGFQSQWEKRKAADSTLSTDSKDSMYGHIDRIATGEIGTLMDRFSDRFGSELDREIIVLRKEQQQDMRTIKPTVELISAPEIEDEDVDEGDEADPSNQFVEFFEVVNELLGGMPEEFIDTFVKSESFELFESVGSNPGAADEDSRKAFFQMINAELGQLPEDKINKFVDSPGFEVFTSMGERYGG